VNDIAYLAGLWDGEGCFTIGYTAIKRRRLSPYWYAVASICMTERGGIELLQQIFGGTIHTRQRDEGLKPVYEWKLWSLKAKHLAETLLPHLRVKQNAAKTLINFQTYVTQQSAEFAHGGNVLTQEDMQRRDAFRQEIKGWNHRGKV
jgi:hypothetical protein